MAESVLVGSRSGSRDTHRLALGASLIWTAPLTCGSTVHLFTFFRGLVPRDLISPFAVASPHAGMAASPRLAVVGSDVQIQRDRGRARDTGLLRSHLVVRCAFSSVADGEFLRRTWPMARGARRRQPRMWRGGHLFISGAVVDSVQVARRLVPAPICRYSVSELSWCCGMMQKLCVRPGNGYLQEERE